MTDVGEVADGPDPGVVLRGYRLSLEFIELTTVTVGGTAVEALRLFGLSKGATQNLQNLQLSAVRSVTSWSDDVGTKVARGLLDGGELAARGARRGAGAWARGMSSLAARR